MQYRRILDREFAGRGLSVAPRVIGDSHITMLAMVRSGDYATIVRDIYAQLMAGMEWCRFPPIEPLAHKRRIGLVVVNRDPLGSMAKLGLMVAQLLQLGAET